MKTNLDLTIESINDNMDVIIDNAISETDYFRGNAFGLSHALFINDIINLKQQEYIESCITNDKHVIIEHLKKLA